MKPTEDRGCWQLLEHAKARVQTLEKAFLVDRPDVVIAEGRSYIVVPLRGGTDWSSMDVLNDAADVLVQLAAVVKTEDVKAYQVLVRAAEVIDACLELEREGKKHSTDDLSAHYLILRGGKKP